MPAPYRRYVCLICGHVYDEALGDPDSGLAPGTRFEDIPDDWSCPLCGVRKSDFVSQEALEASLPAPGAGAAVRGAGRRRGAEAVVVLGAGIAGWSVAEAVRTRAPGRPVVLITACDGDVYYKPSLSTALADGRDPDALVQARGAEQAARLGIELRPRTHVLRVDTARRRLLTTRGSFSYGDLVFALGAAQARLPLDGDGAADVVRVNDLDGYRALRGRLDGGPRRVAILGAGIVGTEFAEDLHRAGHRVTLLDMAPRPMARLLPPALGQALVRSLEAGAVRCRLGVTVEGVDRDGAGYRVRIAGEAPEAADVVISAAGLRPHVRMATRAGLEVGAGIRVDARLRTSVERIYAVGDCAEVEGTVYGYIEPIRRQVQVVAAQLCGEDARFETCAPLVRVKTPSLPLAVCPPVSPGKWTVTRDAPADLRMEHRDHGALTGFALGGVCTAEADAWYARIAPAAAK